MKIVEILTKKKGENFIERILFNKYQILDVLGIGGSATVYLVKHLKLQSFRAVKCVKKDHIKYSQLMNEANVLKNLKHPNIPIIYDIEEDENNAYIIEEYLEGESLRSYCLYHNPIREDLIINFAIQICNVIQFLHSDKKKILYLDIKPENIIVSNQILKLIDFGTALSMQESEKRKYTVGTIGYAAPEQYINNAIDERADIYGIGVLMSFLIMRREYKAEEERIVALEYLDNYSMLKNIALKCLEHSPLKRYDSVAKLKIQLLKLQKNSIISNNQLSLKVSIAGLQERVGTTHVGLMLTSYLNQSGIHSIYNEKNEKKAVMSIVQKYNVKEEKDGTYRKEDCIIKPFYHSIREKEKVKETTSIIIEDYGLLKEDILEEFLKADKCIIIGGIKPWETFLLEEKFIQEDSEKLVYMINFANVDEISLVKKKLSKISCIRIPYEQNPYHLEKSKVMDKFILQAIGICINSNLKVKRWRKK